MTHHQARAYPRGPTAGMVNKVAGSKRMLAHAIARPGQPGWMDALDEAIEKHHPNSWKLYTIGDPLSAKTKYPFWLDDEKLMYPFYDKSQQAGIRNFCIHKGLIPQCVSASITPRSTAANWACRWQRWRRCVRQA